MQHEHIVPTSDLLHGQAVPRMSMSATSASLPTYSRPLSDNEQSYFLQSRSTGANDMILEMEFKAPAVLVTLYRMTLAWAILRVQHPMLAARVEMEPGNYHSCRWVYTPPSSPHAAWIEAEPCIQFQWWTDDDVTGSGANCDRRLSPSMQACAVLLARAGDTQPVKEFRLVLHYAHCHIDGIAAHMVANAFFCLLGGSSVVGQPPRSDAELEALLAAEWAKRWSANALDTIGAREDGGVIPVPAEARLPKLEGKWKVAAARAENAVAQKRIIGGHAFPRKSAPAVKGVSRMMQYSIKDTKTILAHCRAHGVTFSNAVFALCNVAWIRVMRDRPEYNPALPIMMYSAVNLRPLFSKLEDAWQPSALAAPAAQLESFVFLAVSYFSAVLPGFLPPPERMSEAAAMWHRAGSAREQLRRYRRNPMLVPRVHCMTIERGERARRFAKEDDDALRGASPVPSAVQGKPQASPRIAVLSSTSTSTSVSAPSVALIGLSQTGNLDQFYDARAYPAFDLVYAHCYTRKNPGGMLLFAHTLRGRLALQFSWDAAGLEADAVETFWDALNGCVREFMIDAPAAPAAAKVGRTVKGKL